jgi:hypothetical protein
MTAAATLIRGILLARPFHVQHNPAHHDPVVGTCIRLAP